MKHLAIWALALGLSYGALAQENASYHGKKITADNAIPSTELAAKMTDKKELATKVEGTVESVCQVKGCWMRVKTADNQTMLVRFRDYGFFVPKDIAGKNVVFEGTAETKTTSVAELRHYAEDAGKSKEEIAKITEPVKAITFMADGVIVKK
ncbi:DUF4920 domain-containing protein [Larkinella insperata]|uniref:DUF4920 domain-containing protein n=1 Tax=Larkinella insperata TaxID=332158 RepID=A0ABW3Q178_9BACT|nr:DUF4920 domain-containing protein [Larkinella insperata]